MYRNKLNFQRDTGNKFKQQYMLSLNRTNNQIMIITERFKKESVVW